jgi:hypothetical protein
MASKKNNKPSREALLATLPSSQSVILDLVGKGWELRGSHGAVFYLLNTGAACQKKRLPVRGATVRSLAKKELLVPSRVLGSTTIWETNFTSTSIPAYSTP